MLPKQQLDTWEITQLEKPLKWPLSHELANLGKCGHD